MILAIDLTLTHGGGQQVLLDFIKVVEQAGQRVVTLVATGSWLDRTLGGTEDRVSVRSPARSKSTLYWRGVRFARFSWMLLQHRALLGKAKLIVVNDPELFLPSALLASLLRKDTTLYLHMAYKGPAALVLWFVSAFPSVTRLLCVSHFVRSHTDTLVSATARKKLVVIENALPRGSEIVGDDVQPGNMSRIAIVGRLVHDKGQDVVCTLSHQLPDSEFYLVGPFENSDREFVELLRRGSASNVKLVGYQHPIIGYLKEMRIGIVLVPSRIAEAFALTPIEGAAAGCAVIVRNLGGLAEVARNAGLMIVDDDEEFYDSVKRLQAMDPDTLRSHVEATRRQAMAHYHPLRFERDVLEAFDWR
jgi:glycosyltransferase involved in cell wall biosynthesis